VRAVSCNVDSCSFRVIGATLILWC